MALIGVSRGVQGRVEEDITFHKLFYIVAGA